MYRGERRYLARICWAKLDGGGRWGIKFWRRGRDSNPRYGCPYAAFRVRCIQPLCHLSIQLKSIINSIANQQSSCPGAKLLRPSQYEMQRIPRRLIAPRLMASSAITVATSTNCRNTRGPPRAKIGRNRAIGQPVLSHIVAQLHGFADVRYRYNGVKRLDGDCSHDALTCARHELMS